jgi:hypothetical protein
MIGTERNYNADLVALIKSRQKYMTPAEYHEITNDIQQYMTASGFYQEVIPPKPMEAQTLELKLEEWILKHFLYQVLEPSVRERLMQQLQIENTTLRDALNVGMKEWCDRAHLRSDGKKSEDKYEAGIIVAGG